jgi:hypothetical protein
MALMSPSSASVTTSAAEPVDHRLGLLARAAMALLDGDVAAGGVLPVLGERLVELHIELACRIV